MKKKINRIIVDFEDDIIKLKVYNDLKDLDQILKNIEKTIETYYNINGIISLYFASLNTIKDLNLKYRNINKPTDVLSFSYDISKDFLGEIIICFDKIIERAKLEEEKIDATFIYMIFHSYLHLIGFTHDTEKDYQIIEQKTEELMRRYFNL